MIAHTKAETKELSRRYEAKLNLQSQYDEHPG